MPMLSRNPSSLLAPEPTFSFITTLSFSVNNAMGAGFLTIPHAFYHSGVGLGLLCMFSIAIPLLISLPMVLETMARGDLAFRMHLHQTVGSVPVESTPLVKKLEQSHPHLKALPIFAGETQEGRLMVGKEKFEMSELCQMFMGNHWKHFFTLLIALYTYGCLWAFASVFGNSLTLVYPLVSEEHHLTNYLIYVCVYAAIVVPLTLAGIHEQVSLQIFLFYCRVLVVFIMVSTSVYAFVNNDYEPLDDAEPTPFVNLAGTAVVLPIAAYSFLFTPQIPVIAEPVQDKRLLLSIFRNTVYACFIGYSSVAIFVSLLFGSDIFTSCNLHWATYTAGDYMASSSVSLFGKLLVRSLSYYCLAFPAIDVVSAFPLMAIGLGNNLAATCGCCGDEDETDEGLIARRVTIFRLLATVPPVLGACLMSNLGAITSYTGISGCFLGFIFPPLLSIYSEKYFQRRQWNPNTVHSRALSTSCRHAMVVFGVVLICFVLGAAILSPVDVHDL